MPKLDLISRDDQVIKTEAIITDAYRFHVWRTIWEDSIVLGMGYRSYHSHILETLNRATVNGTSFLNPKGQPLRLDALERDDLKGFLGKKNPNAIGPGVRIRPPKFWVLDAFVRIEHPNCALFLDQEALKRSLLTSARAYFQRPDAESTYLHHTAKYIKGIYVPTMRKAFLKNLLEIKEFKLEYLTIPVYYIYFENNFLNYGITPNYFYFEKVMYPVNLHMMGEGEHNGDGFYYDLDNYFALKKKYAFGEDRGTNICAGFGIFSSDSKLHGVTADLIGKHTVRHNPFFSHLNFRSIIDRTFLEIEEAVPIYSSIFSSENKFVSFDRNMMYFRFEKKGQISRIYSEEFEEKIVDYFIKTLGESI